MQPIDVSMFKSLKREYATQITNYRLENNGAVLTKAFFSSVLKKSLESLDLVSIFKNGFRKCGLHPYSADNPEKFHKNLEILYFSRLFVVDFYANF